MKKATLDESEGPGGSYSEHSSEVEVTLKMGVLPQAVCAAKNNSGEIHRVVGVRRGELCTTANVEA